MSAHRRTGKRHATRPLGSVFCSLERDEADTCCHTAGTGDLVVRGGRWPQRPRAWDPVHVLAEAEPERRRLDERSWGGGGWGAAAQRAGLLGGDGMFRGSGTVTAARPW